MGQKNKKKYKKSSPSRRVITPLPAVKWFHVVIIFVLAFAVYSNSLNNRFVYDDQDTIVDNSLIRKTGNIPVFFKKPVITDSSTPGLQNGYRPLTMSSFAINYAFGKLDARGYHLVNVVIHAVNAVLVYVLLLMLFGIGSGGIGSMGVKEEDRWGIALFASLVFAVHPINSEAVNYTWQRSVLLAVLFYIASIILFMFYCRKGSKSLLLISLASGFLALLSKEIAITLPLAIMLIDWYLISGFNREVFKRNIRKYHLPYMFLAGIYLLIRFFGQGAIREFSSPGGKESFYNYFITQLRVIVKYIGLILFPGGLSSEHHVIVSRSIAEAGVLFSIIVIGFALYAAKKLNKSSRTASMLIMWFFIMLIPTSSILPLRIIMNEHRVYLPAIGLIAAIIILVYRFTQEKLKKKALPVILSIIVIVFSVITYGRNKVWENDETLWTDVINNEWKSSKAYNNRGIFYVSRGLHDKAIADFNRALEVNPGSQRAYNNRGGVYLKTGQYDRAIADFKKTIELDPEYLGAHKNLENALNKKRLLTDIKGCDRAVEENPDDPEVYIKRALEYRNRGFYDKALADFNRAIELDPVNTGAFISRGTVYGIKNKYDRAIRDFSRVIEFDPGNASAYVNRGVACWKKRDYRQAEADLSKAIEITPELGQAYHIRGLIYKETGKIELSKNDAEKAEALLKKSEQQK